MHHKILLIDNYDSFTYNLAQYLWELEYDTTVFRNDKISIDEIREFNPSHIVISPGPGSPKDSGISMEVIHRFHEKIPILGVCLGHQCIGEFFGGTIEKAPLPKHGKSSVIQNNERDIFNSLPKEFRAIRYHSLIVREDSIDANLLEITARSLDDNLIMALKHKKLPIYGIQFHPESILTEHGHRMLQNFVDLNI